MNSARVLFIGYPAEGHVNPTLGLTSELIRRGEEVTYYCIDEYRQKIEATGARYRNYGITFDSKQRETNNRTFNIYQKFQYRLTWMEQAIDRVLQDTQNEFYDYVIYDAQGMHGSVIAYMLNLPSIVTWTTFAYNEKSKNWFSPRSEDQIPDKFKNTLTQFSEKFGYPLDHFTDLYLYNSQLNIVFTSKLFQYDSHLFDNRFQFVGPSIYDRNEVWADEYAVSDGVKTLIYISMGTIFNGQNDFYQICFDALKELDAVIVMSVGKKTDLSEIGPVPDNFLVRNYVPQLEILRRASIFVTHAGMNSTNEAIYFNVPLVMIPNAIDQPMIADRAIELGVGVRLNNKDLTSGELQAAVKKVLQKKSYALNTHKVGQSLRNAGGYVRAAEIIIQSFREDFVKAGGSS
ncbi:MGT family glycosyltransferase [Paenibacillus sp. DS2363]|uniref:macrolide family glycosyltransferase n=1 Tax=Paenibacillus TaxID=44249 RepID=UPI0020A04AA6|nr:macrolide family glycosyltransferase [Paenibacillus xylanexedens]MCP1427464.1 MGT family glycosyltransferase [Paenibacillus xylanexedens]